MPKSVELCRPVARAIEHTTWNIPRIRYDERHWRNIQNPNLVENPIRINRYDRHENSIFRAQAIMQDRGWNTEITDIQGQCH